MFLPAKMLSSGMSLMVLLACIVVYGFYSLVIFPLCFHPLRKIPRAHWSVAFPYLGSVWISYLRYSHRSNAATLKAHVQGGDVVRLGYNELSVNCVDNGIRTIYGGGWEKHEWYSRQFASYGVINMFSTLSRDPHSQKKRTMANIYSKSNLQLSAQMKANSHELLGKRILPCLQMLSETGKDINVHEFDNGVAMDFVTAYLFGIKISTNFIQDEKMRQKFFHIYYSRREYEWHGAEVSPVVWKWLDMLRIQYIPQWVFDANDWIESWNTRMCAEAEQYLQQQSDDLNHECAGEEPVVYRYFHTGLTKLRSKDPEAGREYQPRIANHLQFPQSLEGSQLMTKHELMSEMLDHLGAGHETSAITMTYLFWELSKNPDMQSRLYQEVLTLRPQIIWPPSESNTETGFALPESKLIDGLPYLHAVIMETLRLHTPIPGTEPRISPEVMGGSTLGSFTGIPGGVRVAAMPFTLHRNAEVFPQPEKFDPDRWLIKDEEKLKEMHRWFWAFGSGGRMCIGSNLAMQEIKLVVSAVYSNWITEITDDEGITELDAYSTQPQSNKLMLKFVHR